MSEAASRPSSPIEPTAPPPSGWLNERWTPYLVLVALALVAYGRSLFFDFSRHDDHVLIVFNQDFLGDLANIWNVLWLDGFAYMGESSGGIYYRPVLWWSFILDAQIAGGSPGVYHAQNLLVHAVVSCLVFRLLTRLGVARGPSVFLAAVFCVHPALASSVAWIPGRNDSLLALFVLLCVHALLDFLRRPGAVSIVSVLIFWALCLFTKEGAVALCAIAPLLVVTRRGEDGPRLAAPHLMLALGWVVVLLVWIAMRNASLGQFPLFASKIPANIPMLSVYLSKTLFPFGLAVLPSVNALQVIAGVATGGLFALAAWSSRDRLLGNLGVGGVWFFGFLFPALLAPPTTRGLEHRLYVPMIGLAICAASVRLPERMRLPSQWRPAAGILLVLFFLVLGQLRLPVFANNVNYWHSAVTTSPDPGTALENLAIGYYEARRLEEAEATARRALAHQPNDPEVHRLMGVILGALKRDHEAARALERAVEIKPDLALAWDELARVHERLGNASAAAEARERAAKSRRRRK